MIRIRTIRFIIWLIWFLKLCEYLKVLNVVNACTILYILRDFGCSGRSESRERAVRSHRTLHCYWGVRFFCFGALRQALHLNLVIHNQLGRTEFSILLLYEDSDVIFHCNENGFQHHWVVGQGSNILWNEVAQSTKELAIWLKNHNI